MSRFDYVQYDEKAVRLQTGAKALFEAMESTFEQLPDSRAKSLILTKLEEAYMWVGKAIRDDQIARNGSAPIEEGRSES